MDYKTDQKIFPGALPLDLRAWTCRLKPLLHGLSLKKIFIKNHNNIISGCVIIQIKHN